jgi:hypothetical protein
VLLGLGQKVEYGQAPLLLDLGDQIGRVVWRHRRQQARRIGIGSRLDKLELMLGVDKSSELRGLEAFNASSP